jgi:hypothetical protein
MACDGVTFNFAAPSSSSKQLLRQRQDGRSFGTFKKSFFLFAEVQYPLVAQQYIIIS